MADRTGGIDMSVVIVNWNTRDELRECLLSIGRPDSVEVIVVDNASSDDSVGMLRSEFPDVRLIENRENLGFAAGSNRGIAASRGRYILLLNPDSVVKEGALPALVRFGDENERVGIFGPKILNPDGTLQYSCRRFPTLAAGLFRNSPLGRLFPKNPYTRDYLMTEWEHDKSRDVDWVSGAAMVLRREFVEDVGVFDERFFMYCEDVDLGYRAGLKGWRVTYSPGAVVVHARGKSSDKNANRMIMEFHKSMYRFFLKHYSAKSSIPMKVIVPAGLYARAGLFIMRNYLLALWPGTHRRRASDKSSARVRPQSTDTSVGRVSGSKEQPSEDE